MKVEIQAKNLEVTDRLHGLIHKKVEKLEQFYNQIIDAIVYLHDNGDGVNTKEVEIKLIVKNNTLFCKEKDDTIERALDNAADAMARSLKKYKQKIQEK